MTYHYLCKLVN